MNAEKIQTKLAGAKERYRKAILSKDPIRIAGAVKYFTKWKRRSNVKTDASRRYELERQVPPVIRSEARKRAAPWEGRGNRD